MAITTLTSPSITDNEPAASASAEAFIRAFREYRRLDDEDGNTDTPEFQLAMYAFEGAQERAVVGWVSNHDEGAIAALVAFGKLNLILAGGFTVGGGPMEDDDQRAELNAAQNALRGLWRYHDRQGARAVRPFAEFVGAAEHLDRVVWGEGQ